MRIKMQTKLIIVLAAVVLLASVPYVTAQGSGIEYQYTTGMVSLATEDIGVKVTAYDEVPHFHWWNASSPGTNYHVMFLKLFEANDTDSDGAFDPGIDRYIREPYTLPSSDWEFSGFDVVEQDSIVTEVHFNFTTTETFTPTVPTTTTPTTPAEIPDPFDVTIQIRVHIDTANTHEMKFDIVISGWTWAYADSILVFQFTVTEGAHGAEHGNTEPPEFTQEDNRFEFGEGYMEYAEQAQAGESMIQVQGTPGEGTGGETGKSVYLAFENFGDETLEYDPILGITSDDGFGINYIQLLILAGGASVIALVVIAAKTKR